MKALLAYVLHPGTNNGYKLAYPEDAEVALLQCREISIAERDTGM